MMTTQEYYLPISIPEYNSKYSISNLGNVMSIKRGIIMKTCLRNGYISICLSDNANKKNHLIHRLVAITFIENPNNYQIVNHIDGNKLNNVVSNLEWTTYQNNSLHSIHILNNVKPTVPVIQLTIDGTIVNIFNSIKEAESKTGISSKHIPSVCTGSKTSAGGFVWKHVIDQKESMPIGKELNGYPGYIITSNGKVYSCKSNRYLSLKTHESGYISVTLSNGVKKDFYVHVLVATLYLTIIEGKDIVNHKDRDKSNNKVENLEWVTASQNSIHAISNGVNVYTKSVIQYDKFWNEIKQYSSVKDASINTSVDSSSIVRVCKGKQITAGNYFWKYK